MKLSELENKLDDPNYDPELPSKWKVLKWFLIIFIVFGLISGGTWVWRMTVGTGKAVVERTLQPDNVIFQYEKFHDECHDILKFKNQLDSAKIQFEADTALPDDAFGQKVGVLGRDQSNITSIKNQLDQVAQDYNSSSHKWNQSIFKSKNLPYSIDPPNYINSCEYIPSGGN